MLKNGISFFALAALVACSIGGAEDTAVFVHEKNKNQTIIGIHISLLNHPPETHVLGYDKMQRLADISCAEFGKETATYTGKQEHKTLGNAYDTWLERTYRCS